MGKLVPRSRHRIMCGDSRDQVDVSSLMNGDHAQISFTSPPYNAGELNIKGSKTTEKKYDGYDDKLTGDDYLVFLQTVLDLMVRHSDEVFMNIGLVQGNKNQIFLLVASRVAIFKDIIYWKKSTCAPHITPGVINNLVEFILCFGNEKRKFQHAQFSQGTYWNVIEGSSAGGNEYSDIHKATFPVYLPENILSNFCPPGGLVFEPFVGSGTTLIAAQSTGRRCHGMDISPQYVDVTVTRWMKNTGQTAFHETTGEPFHG